MVSTVGYTQEPLVSATEGEYLRTEDTKQISPRTNLEQANLLRRGHKKNRLRALRYPSPFAPPTPPPGLGRYHCEKSFFSARPEVYFVLFGFCEVKFAGVVGFY